MRVLVDTHVWLWMVAASDRLPRSVRTLLEEYSTSVLLSTASVWEISVKFQLGRLALPESPVTYVPAHMADTGCLSLSIDQAHVLQAGQLPLHHGDPFDRMLVAQSQILGVPLVSGDPAFAAYDVDIFWS